VKTAADRAALLMTALLRGKTLDRNVAAQLADVQPAAAYELLTTLKANMGEMIVVEKQDGRAVFRFDGELVAPPPWLAVVAACVGTSVSRVLGEARLHGHMREALGYLLERVRRKDGFTDLERKFVFLARGGESALPEREGELDDVMEAILHSEHARIEYRHSDGKGERVDIQPLSLAIYDHQLYVIARDAKHPVYPYRFSRIADIERLGVHFEYPGKAEYDPVRDFADAFGIFVTDTHPKADVVIRLRGFWARYAYTHRWHPSQRLERMFDDSVTLRLTTRVCPELENWILGLGAEGEVIEPRALREKIAGKVAAMARLYGVPAAAPEAAPAAAPGAATKARGTGAGRRRA
jgi:predicted DNA-binding transcriptional regulator YafY